MRQFDYIKELFRYIGADRCERRSTRFSKIDVDRYRPSKQGGSADASTDLNILVIVINLVKKGTKAKDVNNEFITVFITCL